MQSRIKVFLQYIIILGLTVVLVWFSLRGLQGAEGDKWEYLKQTWKAADKGWLIMMAVVALSSHVLRAQRWIMLMQPSGHHSRLSHSFYSLMVGYLVNLVIPRGGELSRCYNLYKLNKTPVEISFGTVVVERIVDVLCLLVLIILSFILESQKLVEFIGTLPIGESAGESKVLTMLIVLAALIGIFMILFFALRRNQKIKNFLSRTWLGFREGLLSVFRLKNKSRFITYSLLIWILYFVMSYTVIKAFDTTSQLGLSAVLSLFAIGAIAMAAPLPGGTGSYHVLVPQSLAFLYHVPLPDAVAFTFIFHGWQTLIMIVGGALSLVITTVIVRKQKRSTGKHARE